MSVRADPAVPGAGPPCGGRGCLRSSAMPVSRRDALLAAGTTAVTAGLSGVATAASAAVGGKGGGGRPDMAQAGGPEGGKSAEALAAIRGALAA